MYGRPCRPHRVVEFPQMFQRARKNKREYKVVLLSGREGGMDMQTKHVRDGTQENLWDLQSVDQAQGKESIWVDALELRLCERQRHISSTTSERRRDPCDSLPGLAQLVVAAPLGLGLPKDKTVTISVIGGPSKGLRRQLVKPTVSIGRSGGGADIEIDDPDRKSTRLNSSHTVISYAVFCLKKKKNVN